MIGGKGTEAARSINIARGLNFIFFDLGSIVLIQPFRWNQAASEPCQIGNHLTVGGLPVELIAFVLTDQQYGEHNNKSEAKKKAYNYNALFHKSRKFLLSLD